MSVPPGQKTNPNPAPNGSRPLREWRLSLGPFQVVLLIGLITGSMACAFYLGFFSGQSWGLQAARDTSLSSAPRLPIESLGEESPDSSAQDAAATDVYAKLSESRPSGGSKNSAAAKSTVPELGTIQDLESAPLPTAIAASEKEPPPQVNMQKQIDQALANVRVMGGKTGDATGKTLGELAQAQREPTTAKIETVAVPTKAPEPKPTEKPTPTEKPKPTVKPTQAPEPSLVKGVLSSGWYAQIIAPKSQAEAEAIGKKLRTSGFEVVIENALVRGQNYYRVLVGPEENRTHAERLIAQLKREPSIKAEPFLRMVK